jgi:hypothetical protein
VIPTVTDAALRVSDTSKAWLSEFIGLEPLTGSSDAEIAFAQQAKAGMRRHVAIAQTWHPETARSLPLCLAKRAKHGRARGVPHPDNPHREDRAVGGQALSINAVSEKRRSVGGSVSEQLHCAPILAAAAVSESNDE